MEIKKRQLEIIEAAGNILITSGINALTTKNLAKKMGFAESALYRHFTGKEDIILAMLQYLAVEMDKRIAESIEGIENPELKISALFEDQFKFFRKNPHLLVAIFSEGLLQENEKINEAVRHVMSIKRNYVLQIINEGQMKKKFTKDIPAADLAHIIMGAFRLHILGWRMDGFKFDLEQKGNQVIQSVLKLFKQNL
jgi:TetR/AcrR family transcriptional regulator, fatty acid metabolism regulator protein